MPALHTPYRILLVDNHPPIREWLSGLLLPKGFVTIEAATGEQALEIAQTLHPIHAAICDVLMPAQHTEGIAIVRQLWHQFNIPCLIFTSVEEANTRLAAFYAGAFGYVQKHVAHGALLIRSVEALVQGQRPRESQATLVIRDDEACQLAETHAAHMRAITLLTPQQRVVAALILQGKTNKEIATELVLSHGTVNTHVSHILQRLNLASRRAVKSRLLDKPINPTPLA